MGNRPILPVRPGGPQFSFSISSKMFPSPSFIASLGTTSRRRVAQQCKEDPVVALPRVGLAPVNPAGGPPDTEFLRWVENLHA
jgi:hypothetical protein